MSDEDHKRRPRYRWAAFFVLIVAFGFVGYQTLTHPKTPLPDGWNPLAGFSVFDSESPLTMWKLHRVLSDPVQCRAVLAGATRVQVLDPFEASENCHIRNRVKLTAMGTTRIEGVETSCATALRLALWERHGVQPAARDFLNTSVSELRQVGSYNCRQVRTSSGASSRWSTHATADAIDITGFVLADGRRIRLIEDWEGDDPEAQFLRAVRDSACTWFATTLGPDYNRLHADHFHLQARGWGTCR